MKLFRSKPKSTDPPKSPLAPIAESTSQPLHSRVETGGPEASAYDPDLILNVLPGIHRFAYEQTVAAGITEVTDEFAEPIREHARSIGREYGRAEFDPKRHLHDQIEFKEYERAIKSRDEARLGEDHAIARLRQAKAELDATKRVGDCPSRPSFLLILATAMICVSLTATIHDRLMPPGMDQVLSFVLSMMIAALLASAPVYAIFHARNSRYRWIGILVGAIFAVGLFSVRAAGAGASSELLYAAGWACLEIAGVLLAEYFSHAHRKAELEWADDHHKEVAAVAKVKSAEEEILMWRERIAAAQAERTRVGSIVNWRNSRALRAPDIENLCVRTADNAIAAALADNRSVILGLKRPPQPELPGGEPKSREAVQ